MKITDEQLKELFLINLDGDNDFWEDIKDSMKIDREYCIEIGNQYGDIILSYNPATVSFIEYNDGEGWDHPRVGNLKLISKLIEWGLVDLIP